MPNAAYRDGRKLEYALTSNGKQPGWCRANGYEPFRSSGSHGKIDVIAMKPGELLFIQCKKTGTLSKADGAELLRLARMVGAVPLLAQWRQIGNAARHPMFWEITPAGLRLWTPDHALQMEAP